LSVLPVSSTALPVPVQAFSAAWMRAVSGLASSSADEKRRSVAVSCPLRLSQTPGMLGWATVRASPVAVGRAVAEALTPLAFALCASSAAPALSAASAPSAPTAVNFVRDLMPV
jgi:hypothetical protein